MHNLRSDTVTRPTPAVRAAMCSAVVGDDAHGDCQTTKLLEARAAELSGKEAAAFVCSGVMGNLASILAYTEQRGSEVICGDKAHIMLHEGGGCAALAGAMMRTLRLKDDGTWDLDEMRGAIRVSDDPMFPQTRVICLENTQCALAGIIVPLLWCQKVKAIAVERGVKVHLDGARIFNAAARLGCTVKDVAACADSVTFSLSKGLGGPCGSCVCGDAEFIRKVRKARKMLGGTMHQVGVLAAAGLEILKGDILKQFTVDHSNATLLAKLINGLDFAPVSVDTKPHTNMVYMNCQVPVDKLLKEMEGRGLLAFAVSENIVRLVVHYEIVKEDIPSIVERIAAAASAVTETTGSGSTSRNTDNSYGSWNTN